MTATQIAAPSLNSLPSSVSKATFGGALRAEFTKIRSLRSTYWALLVMIVLTVGLGAVASYTTTTSHQGPFFDPASWSLGGLVLSQLVIGALGALVITSEYSTGMIRTSLTVLPQRGLLVAAKVAVFAAVAFVTGLISCFASFFIGQAIMSPHHTSTTLSHPGVLRALIGGALFLTVCGLLALGIGLLTRHTAGAVTAVAGLLFVLPLLGNLLPHSLQNDVNKWLPTVAGAQIWTAVHPPHSNSPSPLGTGGLMFAPWTGFAVFCGYAAIAIAAGVYRFRNRDA